MNNKTVSTQVAQIIKNVKTNGDEALAYYAKIFDKTDITKTGLKILPSKIKSSSKNLPKELKNAISNSFSNITAFHKQELKHVPHSWTYKKNGLSVGQKYTPIESVGIYVPGGQFSYPSTVLMTAIAAKIAGVKKIVIATPPQKINDALLFSASLCGITDIFTVGGAAAIAALCYGTQTIKKVDMIVGPGNIYVNEAKRQVFGDVGIDSLAGPSEVAIICDEKTPDEFLFSDVMAQVEHDKNAKAFVFCSSKNKIEKLQKVLSPQARKQVVCHVSAIDKAIEKINEIAPEHLELLIKNYKPYLNKIFNAGAIFLGYQTPTSSGDYWAGPSHVLPTNANAKFASGLSVMTFLKRSSIVCMNAKDSKAYKDISNFAQSEGLLWHKKSADIRIK